MKRIFTRLLVLAISIGMFQSSANAISPLNKPVGDPDPAVVKAAVESFNKLSKKAKTERIKEVKKAIQQFKATHKGQGEAAEINLLLLILITILIPPLGVYLHEGEINTRFWISLILTLLFYFPGLIYSLIVILGTPAGSKS
jgi:uncharacterized membrane protein YqaE (UPF0057 family)